MAISSTPAHNGVAFRAAEMLADAIRSAPEWEEWEGARAAARTDAGFQALTAHHRALVARLRREPPPAGHTGMDRELARVREQLLQHPAAVRQQAAVREVITLLRNVNRSLSDALGLEFAELAAAPRGGGCCGQ